jgi:catechol 2,3-dioxygenase-like lactoylglutathione lyase family enzyme
MLHHLSFGVSDIHRSAAFYDAVLGALGFVRVWEDIVPGEADSAVGYGLPGGGDKFAIKLRADSRIAPPAGLHLAFAAADRIAVRRFHEAALKNGGRDHGAPGLRPNYGPNYYAAFVVDPDGYHLEAVFSEPA